MDWRLYEPGDAAQLDILDWDTFGKNLQRQFDSLPVTYAYTFLDRRRPYAIGGGWIESPGVVEVYIISDKSIKRHAKRAVQTGLAVIDEMAKDGIRRFQSKVPHYAEPSIRYLGYLGFSFEGVMKSYFEAGDAHLYGKVMHDRV